VVFRRAVERALYLTACVIPHASVELQDALVAPVGVSGGRGEELDEVALRVGVFGEEEDAARSPAAVRLRVFAQAQGGAEVLAEPGEQRERLRIRGAPRLLREGP